jgi:hypothetical protein
MPKLPDFDAVAAHKYFAATCFNSAWPLIDKVDRTPDEDDQLVALGHASLWHWTQRADCTDTNLSIGHWLLSRIYSVLRDAPQARKYAESCLRISQQPGMEPFHLGIAYEAVARSASLARDWAAAASAVAEARSLAERVSDDESRTQLLGDLATIRIAP